MPEIKIKAIPSPSNLPAEIQAFAGPVKEAIDVLLWRIGSGADAAITKRNAGKLVGGATVINSGGPSSGGYVPDLTPPPSPTGLVATPGFSVINLEWDDLPYSAGHGHAHTVIYRSSDALRGNAVQIGMTPGTIYVDAVGSSAGPFFYWARFVSRDGITGPWNAVSGVTASSSVNPEYLLGLLSESINQSHLAADLATRIDLIDGPDINPNSVAGRIRIEAQARADALLAEATARAEAIAVEQAAREQALLDEADARLAAITAEGSVRAAALIAEAAARGTAISEEASARQAGDEGLATQIVTLTASVSDDIAAAVEVERLARVDAVSAEAASRDTLAVQFRGEYTGTDIASVTSGLLYQERIARATADQSLTQQITLLSAGAGEQFDYLKIWYFDSTVESWTGHGAPTLSGGWLRPANHATDPFVVSPSGLAVDAAKYSQVRLRIRKTGEPAGVLRLYWKRTSDAGMTNSETLSDPTYDEAGIGLVTVSPGAGWSDTIDQVRVDLGTYQSATDYYEIDWVAIGRPSPGASSAALLEEQSARASADSAEVTARQTLSFSLTGLANPAGATLATLTSGMLYDERVARSTADSAEVTARQALSTKVTGSANPATLTLATISAGLLYDEKTARSTADATEVTARQSLSATLTGFSDPTGKTLAQLTSGLVYDEKTARVTADSAEVSSRQSLATKITGLADPSSATLATLASGLIFDERTARATADTSQASRISTLEATVNNATTGVAATASALDAVELTVSNGTSGNSALAARTSNLEATVNNATTGVTATAAALDAVKLIVNDDTTGNSALATQTSSLAARINSGGDVSNAIVLAQNTASAKSANFTQGTAPTATRVDDTWIDTANGNRLKRWNGSAWVAADDSRIGATASSLTTLSTTVGGHTTSLATQATSINGLSAQYTVKIDNNGYVSGFGLASTAINGTPTSDFMVRADRFSVISPGASKIVPFTVLATATTINGVSVPAGVYIDATYMRLLVVNSAQIGSAAIDDAKVANLSAAKLTAGDGTIGGRLKSAYFLSAVAGWQIHPDGTAEFNNVLVRGTVYAESGYFKGTLLGGAATSISSGTGLWAGYDSSVYKFRLGVPGSSRMEWNGSAFTIYGSSGQVLMSSGSGIPWSQIDARPTSLLDLDTGAGNKLNGIQAGATVGANANNLNIGLGVNLLPNTEFIGGFTPAALGWNPGGVSPLALRGDDVWRPKGGQALEMYQLGRNGNVYNIGADVYLNGSYGDYHQGIPVTAGKRYEFSAKLAAHRCDYWIAIGFFDAAGTILDEFGSGFITPRLSGGPTFSANAYGSGWTHAVIFRTAPAGAAFACVYWRKSDTDVGEADSYAWLCQPFFGEALASQTAPSTYSPGYAKGAFSSVDKLTTANVTTFIENAAIGNAQIGGDIWSSNYVYNSSGWYLQRNGNLYCANAYVRGDVQATSLNAGSANIVSTLHLQGEAVTVPRSAYTAAEIGVGTGTVVQSCYIDAAGQPVSITGSITARILSNGASSALVLELYAPGGSLISSGSAGGGMAGLTQVCTISVGGVCSEVGTYTLKTKTYAGSAFYVSSRFLQLLGTKR